MHGKLLRPFGCSRFRNDLSEDQDEKSQHAGCHAGPDSSEYAHDKSRGEGRSRKIHHVIADQDHGNRTAGQIAQDVAAHLGISRTLLDLRFREMGSATVGQLLSERRLAALSALLRKSKAPISRLAKECGFGSINHAKAVFKKRFGMTMRDYRRSAASPDASARFLA